MAFSTPITVTGRVMTVPVQAVVTPDVSIAVSPDNVAEDGATNLTYTVTRSAASTSSLTVNLNTSGTATSGTDYTGAVATVVIPANATTATVTLNPTADATIESDETATLTVVSGSGYNVGTSSSATGTILNDDLPSLAINDVTLSEGNSGTTSATFTVSLSAPAGPGGVTFDIATANGTATAGSDYTANSLTSQTITSGSSTYAFTVQLTGDTTVETNEIYFVNVTNVTGAVVVDGQGVGTIVNDDVAPPAVTVSSISPAEGAASASQAPANVTITGTNFSASGNAVTFGGTAGSIVSENATTIVVAPPARSAGGLVDVVVTNASAQSDTEANAYRYLLPPTVAVSWSPDSITTSQTTTFSVTLTNPNDVAIQNVAVSSASSTPFTLTAFGTFCGGTGNYNASASFRLSGLNLAPGESCTAISTQRGLAGVHQFVTTAPTSTGTAATAVTLTGVAATSNTITVYGQPSISLINPNRGPMVGGQAVTLTGTNFNGATAVTIDGVAATDVTVISATSITATTPAGASSGPKVVAVTGPGGTGTRTNFFTYIASPAVTSISPAAGPTTGGTAVTITGTDLTGATAVTFGGTAATSFTVDSATQITATVPAAGAAGAVAIAVTTPGGTATQASGFTYFIPRTVSVTAPATINEGDTGNGFSTWGVALDAASTVPITVNFRTVAGTATSPADFGAVTSGSATIAAGVTGFGANVFIVGDTLDEDNETFSLEIVSVSTGGVISSTAGTATGTIIDNDATPALSINDVSLTEGNAGTSNLTFTVSLGTASGRTVTVDYATANGTATAPGDFAAVSGTLTFMPGQTSQPVTVTLNGDTTFEANESLFVNLSSAMNATISDNQGLGTITNDDVAQPVVTSVSPSAGPAQGGNTVTIAGANFSGATAVTFGVTPATSFTVNSATQITATVPLYASSLIGSIAGTDVIVTTAGGDSDTSGAGDNYSYVGVPSAPELNGGTGFTTGDNTPEFSGGAQAGSTVELFIDGQSVGTTTAAGNTNWVLTVPTLADGSYSVYATASNIGGRSAQSATWTFTVDTTAPSIPVITSPTSGRILQTLTTVSGTGEPNTAVIVYINDGTTPPPPTITGSSANPSGLQGYRIFGSAEVGANGLWTASRRTREPNGNVAQAMGPQSLGEAPVSIVALGQDNVGNQSDLSGVVTLTLDSTPPITPPSTSQTPAQGTTLNTSRPNFCGVGAEAGADVTVFVNGNPYARGLVTQGGSWCALTEIGDAKPTESLSAVAQGLPAGPHSWYAVFTDAAGNNSTPTTTITFNIVLVAVTQTSVPNGAVASAYSQTLTATGGTGPYSFTLDGGALPAGLTLSTGGVLSGTPTAGGTFNFTVRATDSVSQSATQAFSLTIAAPTVTATSTVPAGRRGFAYSQTLTGSGGTGPYSFSLQSGALPAGITLSTTGVLSGTPTVIGSFPIGVRVTDSSTGTGPYSSTVNLTLVVNAAAITVTPTSLPGVMAGLPYEQVMSATGGAGTYTYAVTAGALPNGIILTSAGRLVGSSYAVGTFGFTVTATDSFSNTGSVALSLVILARPDPSQDPDVRGLNAAQAEATRRLTSTQIENFSRRLEDLRNGGTSAALSQGIQFQSGIAELGQQSDPRTRFGGGRMIEAPAYDPDRAELNAMLWQGQGSDDGAGPIDRGPSGLGLATGGAPALAGGMGGARADGGSDPTGGVRLWTGGSITVGERDADSGQAALSISSRGLSVGADFAVTPTFDLGFGGGMGEETTDVGSRDSSVDSSSWVGVVYGSWRPDDGIYVDGMLGHGSLSFDMSRRVTIDNSLVTGSRDGTAIFGSLAIGFDRLVGDGRLSTYGRLESLNAELDAYTETGSPFWALSYASRDVESLQGVVGGRYIWSRIGRDSIWTPGVRAEYRQELAEGGLQALRYADWVGGPVYQIDQSSWDRGELNLGFGLDVQTLSGWVATGEVTGRFSDGQTLGSVRLGLSRKF
ncbi:MAG: IPT/TIG domain-containing protein [Caulobacteraceae bacterium]|nr:IPT/TIG domain-containing protein [Caulobacteraceae bacterium]